MKIIRSIAAVAALSLALSAAADGPFRAHRYDSFQATPTEPGQIVFAGNSITNMHSWFEAFGSHQDVIGRGNSGGFASEILTEVETYIDSKPSKLFLMIGTNDISSGVKYARCAEDIQIICKRVRMESPETEIYLETILPRSSNAKPDYERCNDLTRQFVAELNDPKVHLVDLSEVMAPLGVGSNSSTWSCWDGLHPRSIGYQAWCRYIQDLVGYPTVYDGSITAAMQTNPAGLNNSAGGRAEQFMFYPVMEGDVLFYGDDNVHQGEWHELLRSNKIKDRGGFWSWGGYNLVQAKNIVKTSLENQAVKPSKIFLFYGMAGQDGTNYRALVDEAKKQAPEAGIYLVSLTPSTNANNNTNYSNFNKVIKTVAEEKGCTYVDIYTPVNADINKNIMHTNYLSGRGYIVVANELAKHIEGTNPVSLAEYDQVYNRRAARKTIGAALTNALRVKYGNNPGQIKEEHRAEIEAAIAAAVEVINDPELNADKATAAASALTQAISTASMDLNMPEFSTADAPKWYTLCSTRGGKPLTATTNGLVAGSAAVGAATAGADIWRFEKRSDETFNIVNVYGQYINPKAKYNTQMGLQTTEPTEGFQLSYSNNTPGTYVIYAGSSQLNQTSLDNKVYNWYKSGTFPDRADQGCSWALSLYEGIVMTADKTPTQTGWYEIVSAENGMTITNMDDMMLQNGVNNYSLQYVLDPAPSPRNWVYMEVNGANCTFRTHNGFYLNDKTIAARTPDNYTFVASTSTAGAYDCKYWMPFNIKDSETGETIVNIVGRSSAKVTPHYFQLISAEKLAEYDIWTVNILGDTKGSLPQHDAKITIPSDSHHGLQTVFHNGTYFVEKGTNINAGDVQITHAHGVTTENTTPKVTVDPSEMIITVDYNHSSGIGELIEQPKNSSTIFDLWGRRVASPRHGLYIMNGRKVRI